MQLFFRSKLQHEKQARADAERQNKELADRLHKIEEDSMKVQEGITVCKDCVSNMISIAGGCKINYTAQPSQSWLGKKLRLGTSLKRH